MTEFVWTPELEKDAGIRDELDPVLDVRAERLARVRDYLSDATSEDLKSPGTPPPWYTQECSVLSCFRVVLNEEWWHHQFVIRDLAVLERRPREWRDQGV